MFSEHFKDTFTQTLYPEGVKCFTPNGCIGARLKENLSSVNAVYADWDFKPKSVTGDMKPDYKQFMLDLDTLPTPTYVVESGNGWHLYWLLTEPVAVSGDNRADLITKVEGIHQHIHEKYGSDRGACDVLRLMRLPGYEHKKMPEYPFMVKIVEDNSDTTYTLDELLEAIPPVYQSSIVEHVPSDSPFDIRQVAIDVWAQKGDVVTFDTLGRMTWNGKPTGTFIGRHGDGNYIATTSDEYPAKGNAVTYVSGVLDISTSDAYKWLGSRYGFPEVVTLAPVLEVGDIDLEDLMYTENKNGVQYLANDENIIRIFNHYKLAKYDTFNARPFLCVAGKWIVRDSGSDGLMYSWLVEKFPFLAKVTVNRVADLLTFIQYRNSYDSAQDYVNSLTWDGDKRLDSWLSRVFFVEDDTYYRDIGSKWFMGMVARIMQPGCKFDNALVVHGGQKIGKSSVFLIIAGEENHIEFTDLKVREMQQDMQGKLIVEFAEAAIFSKADSESLKSIVSRQTDTFRVPYERHAKDFPRRCVFAVTANNDDILKDSTGGRRWWAVDVPDDMKCYPPKRQADIHWLRANRDQLFAEAAVRVRSGEDFRNIDEYELMKRQKPITATEQDEDLFFDWYNQMSAGMQNEGVTIRDAYVGAYKKDYRGEDIDINSVSIKKTDEMRVARILKKIGLEKRKMRDRVLWIPGEMFDRTYEPKLYKTVHERRESNW